MRSAGQLPGLERCMRDVLLLLQQLQPRFI
jgi:hypothetical protein